MQCENGYTKPGVKGILCRKAKEPKDGDLRSVAHALCGHQRFCPNQRCYQFLPSWEKCTMRGTSSAADAAPAELGTSHASRASGSPQGEGESREEGAGEEMPVKKGKRTAKKKSAEKAADGE